MPPPYRVVRARLDRALTNRDLGAVRSAARELPTVVTLADAVRVLVLMREADDPAFQAAAVRWSRFTSEATGATLGETHAALESLDALPAPDAQATLNALLKRHGTRPGLARGTGPAEDRCALHTEGRSGSARRRRQMRQGSRRRAAA